MGNLLEGFLEQYEAHEIMKENLLEDTELSEATADYIYEGTDFSQYNWEGLNNTGKMRELQTIEDKLAELQGREAIAIKAKNLDNIVDKFFGRRTQGYYDPQTNEIYINEKLLKSGEHIRDMVDTVAHEGMHAYQRACVEGKINHSNPEEVELWRENFNNYLDARIYGMEAYINQPLEASAFRVGGNVAQQGLFA